MVVQYKHPTKESQTADCGEVRHITLSLDIPHDVMLRVIMIPTGECMTNVRLVSQWFNELAETELESVATYLRAFLYKIHTDCKFAPYLPVRSEKLGSDFDFPRCSPSFMMLMEFCRRIAANRQLYDKVKSPELMHFDLKRFDD